MLQSRHETYLPLADCVSNYPPLIAAEKGKKTGHSHKKTTEMKAESDAIDFNVTGAAVP